MIDEIDKMGADYRGDPASAMLEVLDPEQNGTFRDHYLDLPFDLSRVFFICTANQLDTIPPALRDRMEVIELSGYTQEEKREIAKRYLVPRQMERNGVGRSKIEFTAEALEEIVDGYTREAGVRGLEREIGSICRKVAREFAEGTRRSKRVIRAKTVGELLGKRRVQNDVKARVNEPGVATGLAWTPVGGDVLFVEATAYPGDGKLQITGQLGDVMKESAAAALSYIRTIDSDVPDDYFREHDVHIHVPAGAIPKDGPSAGITMATALASRATGRAVRADTAMTGEITLTGQVLPIGGLKEKALAAQRVGINRLIIPRRNEADIDDIPAHLRKRMKFVLVDSEARGARRRAGEARDDETPVERGVSVRGAPGRVQLPLASGPEESNGSKEKGREGRRRSICRRQGGPLERLCPAPGRGPGAARQPAQRLRLGEEGLRAGERQGPGEGPGRQEGAT